jgi:hypothetical protein
MDKNSNMKNRIGVEVDQFDLVVIKESAEEVAGREAKSALEEGGKHQNLGCIWCRNVFPGGRTQLHNCVVWEKIIRIKLADFILIHDGRMEKVRVQGSHDWEEGSQQHEIGASMKGETTGN